MHIYIVNKYSNLKLGILTILSFSTEGLILLSINSLTGVSFNFVLTDVSAFLPIKTKLNKTLI